jgi:glucokinase
VNPAAVLALDVGGTSIKAALFDEFGAVARRNAVRTPVDEGPDAVVAAVRGVARELTGPGVVAVGVVVPGVVEAGVARYSANLGWRDVPLGELLAAELGVPVSVEHDVRAAGLAERTIGRARGVADCLLVVIGTGIAGVVVSGGEPVRGALGLAGEIGHLPVYPDGEPCACGQRGCTEVYASAAGIARRYRARTGVARTSEEIAASLSSDADAAQVWAGATDALGLALATCTLVLDPSLVVLAGGLAGAGDALREPVEKALRGRLAWRAAPDVEISPLAGRAGLHGAALLAWQAAGRDDVGAGWSLN